MNDPRSHYTRPFPQYDLRTGAIGTVIHAPDPEHRDELTRAIEESHGRHESVAIAGEIFEVSVDLTTCSAGTGSCQFTAGSALKSGRVPPGTVLFFGATASRVNRSPLAWRTVLRAYISAVAKAPPLTLWNAPGGIPRSVPWFCGYSTTEIAFLSPSEIALLRRLIRSTAVILMERGERAMEGEELARGEANLEGFHYPELEDWDF